MIRRSIGSCNDATIKKRWISVLFYSPGSGGRSRFDGFGPLPLEILKLFHDYFLYRATFLYHLLKEGAL